MTSPAWWLERLAQATDYRELQEAYAGMAEAAQAASNPEELAASIDDAIDRLQRERARDETELAAYEAEYESFRSKQGGVFGWVRRHTPFTETRKQEKGHQAGMADQGAEILADNLFIARAQMLKESILPAAARALGADTGDWRRRLAAAEIVTRIRDYAESVAALGRELAPGQAFLAEAKVDVEAFAKAKFADDEDRRRKRVDLQAARGELARLTGEIQGKADLRAEGSRRLRALITEELEEDDTAFRALSRHVAQLEQTIEHATASTKGLEGLRDLLAQLVADTTKLEAVQARRSERSPDEGAPEQEAALADRRHAHTETVAAEYEARMKASEEAVAQEEAALSVDATGAPTAERLPAGPALEAAEAAHRVARSTYEAARAEADVAERAAREARQAWDERRRAKEELAREEASLRSGLDTAQESWRRLVRDTSDSVGAYDDARARVSVQARSEMRVTVPLHRFRSSWEEVGSRPRRPADLERDQADLMRLLKALREEHTALEQDLGEERRRKEAAWSRRAQELLGDALASEIF